MDVIADTIIVFPVIYDAWFIESYLEDYRSLQPFQTP